MKESFGTFALGGLASLMLLMFAIDMSPTSHKNIVEHAIKECEKSLPRDQHCTIVALPVDKE